MNSLKLNIHDDDGLMYVTFPHFDKTELVHHCFSTKRGGVSQGIYESLNLGFTRGDDEELVRENYKRLCHAIGIDENNLVMTHQVHDTQVRVVTSEDLGKGYIRPRDYENIDGLITNEPGVPLMTFYADCVPLLFLDPVKKVIGTSHAGWRGTVNQIGAITVAKMAEVYGCDPEDILVGIGPSIGLCCFEVGPEVAEEFESKLPQHASDIIKAGQKGKYMIDLWTANKKILIDAGILDDNIVVTDLCTKCNKDTFYSHRGHNGLRGSLGAIIQLKEKIHD